LVKGFSTSEIARQLGVSDRTIERDFQEIRAKFHRINERDEVRSWALADAEYGEMWRECWVLFHRPTAEGENDRVNRLAVMDRLLRIKAQRDALAFGTQAPHTPTRNSQLLSDEAVGMVINLLPTSDREQAIESVRNRIALLEKSP
jgi:hypothetical protein